MRASMRVLTLLFCGALAGSAIGAHITDKLVVGMYAQPSPAGSPLKLLSSGTPIEVLQQKDGYTEVRLDDGTQGWVASSYVTDEKPAKAMLLETQARLRQMGIELAALREQQAAASDEERAAADAGPSERETELRESLSKAEARVAELEARMGDSLSAAEARVGELERQLADRPASEPRPQQLQELQARVDRAVSLLVGPQASDIGSILQLEHENPIVRYRYWILAGVALLCGFVAGAALIDYRFRRRHGGFRF